MTARNLLFALMILCAVCLSRGVAAAETSPAASEDETFTTTTVHIEADPWHMLKIERRWPLERLEGPTTPTLAGKSNKPANLDLRWFGLLGVDHHYDEELRPCTTRASLLKIPFFSMLKTDRDGKQMEHLDMYWFAFFDGFVNKRYDRRNAYGGNSTYARLAFVDAPLIFRGFEMVFSEPKRIHWRALVCPVGETLSHVTDEKKNEWKVLDLPFFMGYRYDRNGNDTDVKALDIPFFEAFSYSSAARKTKILDATVVGLYSNKPTRNGRRTWEVLPSWAPVTVAAGETSGSLRSLALAEVLPDVDDSRFFSLWRREADAKAGANQQFVKLPFLGPVFAVWSDGGDSRWGVLPKLTRWRNCPESFRKVL